ncbi:MAG: SpoIIE family protein phosphatase [Streptomycetaceae bacterium]|nr:SpoIIE family protein phosphatase [Streptomycetaceae bacterium]
MPPGYGDHLAHAVLAQNTIGVIVFDADLRVTATNATPQAFPRTPVRVGASAREVFAALEADEALPMLRKVWDAGTPLVGQRPVGARAPDGTRLYLGLAVFRVPPGAGKPVGLLVTVADHTAQVLAESRRDVVHQAAASLGASLDVTTTARQLADLLAPGMADLVAVDLAEAVLAGDEPAADPLTGFTREVRAAVAPEGVWPAALGQVGETLPVPMAYPEVLAMERGATLLVPRLAARRPEELEHARAVIPAGAHSVLAVPLFARGRVLGSVQLWRTVRPEPFDRDDARLVEEVASRAALSVDNARRYTRERTVALALQRSLLPGARADEPGAETFGAYLPTAAAAGVGGDWYDVIPLSSLRLAFVVGDVVGHGLRASATMGRLRTAVQALADMDLSPDELLAHLDDLVLRPAADTDEAQAIAGATCLYAEYDPVTGRCRIASAGHPPPAVVDPHGHARFLDLEAGPPLGIGGLPFEVADHQLAPGSVLVLYSDGLLLGPDHDVAHGMRRLLDQLGRPDFAQRPLDACGHELVDTLVDRPLTDDTTVLLARVRPLPAEQSVQWDLPADPACVARARDLALERLALWGLDELAFTTELVVSELVTNAVRYGGAPITLRLICGDVLVCEVSDPSNTQPRLRRAHTTDEGGRGLFLVAQLTKRWGSRYQQSGKTIWAEQELGPEPARELSDR